MASLLAVALAAPGYAPLAVAHAPLAVAHAPVAVAHAPVAIDTYVSNSNISNHTSLSPQVK